MSLRIRWRFGVVGRFEAWGRKVLLFGLTFQAGTGFGPEQTTKLATWQAQPRPSNWPRASIS